MRSKVVLAILTAFAAAFSIAGASSAIAAPHATTPVHTGPASPITTPAHHVPGYQRHVIRLDGGQLGYWRCEDRSACLYDDRYGQGRRETVRSCGFSILYNFLHRAESVYNRTGRYVDLWSYDRYRGWNYLGTVGRYDRGNLPYYLRNVVDAVDVNC